MKPALASRSTAKTNSWQQRHVECGVLCDKAAKDLQLGLLVLPKCPAGVSIHLEKSTTQKRRRPSEPKRASETCTSSSQGRPLESTMKSAANTSKHRGTGMIVATAAETAADACSNITRIHSATSKTVAAPEAANFGKFSKRRVQSRMTAESPNEFDKYLGKDGRQSEKNSVLSWFFRGPRTRVCFGLGQMARGSEAQWDCGMPTR